MLRIRQHETAAMRTAKPHNIFPSPAGSYSSYTPYGYRAAVNAGSRIAYAGEWLELLLDGYFLGNGYRVYSTVLMRFISPDSFSPFDKGGLGSYCYCGDDPINNVDPSGHMFGRGKETQMNYTPVAANAKTPTLSTHRKPTTKPIPKDMTRTLVEKRELKIANLGKIRHEIQEAMKVGNIELAGELDKAYDVQSEAIKASDDALNKLYTPEQTPSKTPGPQIQQPANITKNVRQGES